MSTYLVIMRGWNRAELRKFLREGRRFNQIGERPAYKAWNASKAKRISPMRNIVSSHSCLHFRGITIHSQSVEQKSCDEKRY